MSARRFSRTTTTRRRPFSGGVALLVHLLLNYCLQQLLVVDTKFFVTSMSVPSSSSSSSSSSKQHTAMSSSSSSSKSSPLVVQTIDIGEYIDNIESKLLESIKNGKTTYRRKLSEPNRKPMVRTLLGYPNKVEFDEAIRIASNRIEYERIVHFYQNTLLPQLDDSTSSSSSSSSSQQLWKVHVPDLKDRILQALDQSMTFDKLESTSSPSLLSPFRRLATGPRYKGKTLDMLQDLFPTPSSSSSSSTSSKSSFSQQRSDVVQAYIEATKPLTESEILESVCESRRLYLEQTDRNHPQLLDTALYLCTCNFDKNGEDNEEDDDDGTNGDVVCPIQSGKDCEKACYEYLQQQQREVMTADTNEQDLPNNNIVLQNVYIKTYNNAIEKNLWNDNNSNDDVDDDSNKSRRNRQIMHYQRQQRQKQQKKQGQRRNNGNVRTGTIWTSLPRKNTCSEFDVIVVNPTTNCVVEIWEAKKSMSPSSLWDAITGKLTALQQLIQDDTSILVYDINDEDNNADSSSGVDVANSSTDSTLPMSTAYLFTNDNDVDDEQDDDDTDNVETTTRRRNIITFGMFGLELLPVPRAIGQLLAMCAASIVSDVNNTQVIVEAVQQQGQQQVQQQQVDNNGNVVVETVEINVETHSLLNDVQILKSKYNEAIAMKDNFCCNNNVNIVLQILTNTTTTTTTQSTNQNDSSNQASSKRGGTIK